MVIVPSHVKKNAIPRRSKMRFAKECRWECACVCVCVCRTARGAPRIHRHPRLLHVDEEVALEDVLPLLVLLGLFIRLVIFPPEYGPALAAIDVPHGVVACSHLAVIRFAFDNVYHVVKQVGTSMLAIECPGYHRVNGSEVSTTAQTAVYAGPRQVTSIAHAHGGKECGLVGVEGRA